MAPIRSRGVWDESGCALQWLTNLINQPCCSPDADFRMDNDPGFVELHLVSVLGCRFNRSMQHKR